MTNQKLFTQMTADEQMQWVNQFGEYLKKEWSALQAGIKSQKWDKDLQRSMENLISLLLAWPFARDFCEKALRYGDYASRAYRMPLYVEKVKQLVAQLGNEEFTKVVYARLEKPRRGRPVSAETLAKREAEKKAAEMQVEMFQEKTVEESAPAEKSAEVVASAPQNVVVASQPFINPISREDAEYKLSIAQKRGFLSPDLQAKSDTIRALRAAAAAASERAKTMSDMKASAKAIEPVAQEAIKAHDAYMAIYADIDKELGTLWYRLQNDSPEWRDNWCKRYGFKSATELHPDLVNDLKKHYQKVQSPEFDLRCRTLIEQESPEYIAKQAEDAAKKKEVQDILRYLKRKDKSQKLETARTKFRRLEELLGKKEAADYKPLLKKIEEQAKSSGHQPKK